MRVVSGRAHLTQKFGEAIEECGGAKPLAIVDGRIAADDFAWGYIVWNAALRGGHGAIADGAVPGNADLSGKDDMIANSGGSGEANLCAEERISTHRRTMTYLNEIIDLCPGLDARLSNGSPVDAGISLDFNVVFEDSRAGLKNLVPGSIGLFGKAEAICSYNDAIL